MSFIHFEDDCSFKKDVDQLMLSNIRGEINKISAYSNITERQCLKKESGWIVDRHYGQVYTASLPENFGVYGCSKLIPDTVKISGLNVGGYLRAPFRKIPRVFVGSIPEYYRAIHYLRVAYGYSDILFRGQTREYFLSRTEQELNFLYNDKKALEPSLTPSSVRKEVEWDNIAPYWMWLVTGFLYLSQTDQKSDVKTIQMSNLAETSTPSFELFCMSLAQQYGLPSNALDVTKSPDVALFFALNDLCDDEHDNIAFQRAEPRPESEFPSVVYVFKRYHNFSVDHAQFNLNLGRYSRPEWQVASFLANSWGLCQNQSAEQLVAAIYIDDLKNFQSPLLVEDLFPSLDFDFVAYQIYSASRISLPSQLSRFLRHFRIVV